MATIQDILVSCVQKALGLPRDDIATDIRDRALDEINDRGREIFDAWPWDNTKIDQFDAPAPVSGVITFASTVDVIRAIRVVDANGDDQGPIFNQDEILASIQGQTDLSEVARYENLADDASGNRRIRVEDDTTVTRKVLALNRFVAFTSSATDLAKQFQIRHAEIALKEFVCDALREYIGYPTLGKGPGALKIALDRATTIEQREIKVTPRHSWFTEIGELADASSTNLTFS